MSKHQKQYVIPIRLPEDKQKIRNWVGAHNGMSILKTDWVFDTENFSITSYETYVLGITNPKTEMLYLLSFPEAIEKGEFEAVQQEAWVDNWTFIVKT